MSLVALLGHMCGGTFLSLPHWHFHCTLIVVIAARAAN